MTQSYILSINSPCAPVHRQLEDPASGASNDHVFSLNHKLFLKPLRSTLASQVSSQRCLVVRRLLYHRFHQRLMPQGPSFCVPNAHGKKPTHLLGRSPMLGRFFLRFQKIDMTAHSSLSTTAPKSLSTATKTPPDVCLKSSLLALSSVPRLRRTLLHIFVELLLLPPLVLNPKEDVDCAFVPFHVLPYCTLSRSTKLISPCSLFCIYVLLFVLACSWTLSLPSFSYEPFLAIFLCHWTSSKISSLI